MASHRNFMLPDQFKDAMINWLKEMLHHSFVLGNSKESYLDTLSYFEELVEEYRLGNNPETSRLKRYVPTVGLFHTALPMRAAFELYDRKYAVSSRRHVSPSFNEIRHMLNIAQILAIGTKLSFISFDGDQTLYSDGGNFEEKEELSFEIISLIRSGVIVAVVTAAGYGLDGSKYEVRLRGLLRRFVSAGLTAEQVQRFYVVGGECNYLLQCCPQNEPVEAGSDGSSGGRGGGSNCGSSNRGSSSSGTGRGGDASGNNGDGSSTSSGLVARLVPVPTEVWQAETIVGPKPSSWPHEKVQQILDVAEASMRETREELRLRAKILRKDRAIGMFPGGEEMAATCPQGHGSLKLKREALDEVVLRAMEALRVATPKITLPYCAFNGGRDAWLDVGNKRIGVEALQAFFKIPTDRCLHVGDQFLATGNDLAARQICPCIWIVSPNETLKVLEHVLRYCLDSSNGSLMRHPYSRTLVASPDALPPLATPGSPKSIGKFNVYTGLSN